MTKNTLKNLFLTSRYHRIFWLFCVCGVCISQGD